MRTTTLLAAALLGACGYQPNGAPDGQANGPRVRSCTMTDGTEVDVIWYPSSRDTVVYTADGGSVPVARIQRCGGRSP